MSLFALSGLLSGISSLFFGLFVYSNNKKSKANKLWLFFCVSVAIWGFGAWGIGMIQQEQENLAVFLWRIVHIGVIFIPVFFLHFVFTWLEIEKKLIIFLAYFVGLFFLIINLYDLLINFGGGLFINDVVWLFDSFYWDVHYNFDFYWLFVFLWFFGILYAHYKLLRVYKKYSGIKQAQIKLFLIAFAISYAGGGTCFLPCFNINLYPFLNLATPFYPIIMSYAIIKYKFLDIKVFAARILIVVLNLIAFTYIFVSESFREYIIKTLFFMGMLFTSYLLKKSFDQEIKQEQKLNRLSKKLAKANKKLKQLDQAKSEFISIASHQLRTPLGAVKGFVSLLLEESYGEISEKVKEVLKKISTSNQRLLSLVSDLLDLSRIEAGKMQYDFAYRQIEDIVKEIKETLSLKAEKEKLYLKVNFPPRPLPKIRMDGAKIREVISNLVENAIKYTNKGEVEVNFKQEDNLVRIIVSDTGIGISHDEMPLLFSKFSRGKNVGRIDTDGTGLGLFVGRKIVEAHGGKIWAESEGENKGSKFIVEIPIDSVRKTLK